MTARTAARNALLILAGAVAALLIITMDAVRGFSHPNGDKEVTK